jgi:hypothetical protein
MGISACGQRWRHDDKWLKAVRKCESSDEVKVKGNSKSPWKDFEVCADKRMKRLNMLSTYSFYSLCHFRFARLLKP